MCIKIDQTLTSSLHLIVKPWNFTTLKQDDFNENCAQLNENLNMIGNIYIYGIPKGFERPFSYSKVMAISICAVQYAVLCDEKGILMQLSTVTLCLAQ